jgi:hypothetical protein
VQILEAVIVFTALTTIVVVSFSLASGFALYQAVAAETRYAVGGMTQLGYGAQSIADGREATEYAIKTSRTLCQNSNRKTQSTLPSTPKSSKTC